MPQLFGRCVFDVVSISRVLPKTFAKQNSAASAIAANTFLRSLCGSVFPLFATYMIDGMGIQWAGTLLGCVAALLVPLPLIFYLRGAKIREKSSFAPTFPKAVEAVHAEKDIEEV